MTGHIAGENMTGGNMPYWIQSSFWYVYLLLVRPYLTSHVVKLDLGFLFCAGQEYGARFLFLKIFCRDYIILLILLCLIVDKKLYSNVIRSDLYPFLTIEAVGLIDSSLDTDTILTCTEKQTKVLHG